MSITATAFKVLSFGPRGTVPYSICTRATTGRSNATPTNESPLLDAGTRNLPSNLPFLSKYVNEDSIFIHVGVNRAESSHYRLLLCAWHKEGQVNNVTSDGRE